MPWPFDNKPPPSGNMLHHLLPVLAQAQSPSDILRDRPYPDNVPPVGPHDYVTVTGQINQILNDYARPRVDKLKEIGVPAYEAWKLIEDMPDWKSLRERLIEQYNDPNAPHPDTKPLLPR